MLIYEVFLGAQYDQRVVLGEVGSLSRNSRSDCVINILVVSCAMNPALRLARFHALWTDAEPKINFTLGLNFYFFLFS